MPPVRLLGRVSGGFAMEGPTEKIVNERERGDLYRRLIERALIFLGQRAISRSE
jgi:hypothetical protein